MSVLQIERASNSLPDHPGARSRWAYPVRVLRCNGCSSPAIGPGELTRVALRCSCDVYGRYGREGYGTESNGADEQQCAYGLQIQYSPGRAPHGVPPDLPVVIIPGPGCGSVSYDRNGAIDICSRHVGDPQ